MTTYNQTDYQLELLKFLKPKTVKDIHKWLNLDIEPSDQDWRWVHKYPAQVLFNVVPSGKLMQQAALRHFQDCERDDLVLDEKAANSIMTWFSFCPIPDGEMAGEPLTLDPPLIWMSVSLIAWLWSKDVYDDIEGVKVKTHFKGLRRYKENFSLVARKFSKTTWAAAITLYLIKKGAYRSRAYSFATTLSQAKEVWTAAASMIDLSEELSEEFTHNSIHSNQPVIEMSDMASTFHAKAGNSSKQDGLNPSVANLDECHAIEDYNQYGVITSAFGAQPQYLFNIITTAGTVLNGLCTSLLKTGKKVLDPYDELNIDTTFYAIFQMDDEDLEGDGWKNERNWLKANPSTIYGRPNIQYLRTEFAKAKNDHAQKVNFLTKNCNIFVNSATKWLDVSKVRQCVDPELDIAEFRHDPCIMAFDRAVTHDVTSLAKIFKRNGTYYVFWDNLQTQNAVNNSVDYLKDVYMDAEASGHIEIIDNKSAIDTDEVVDMIESAYNELPNCQYVAFDPYKMREAANKLEEKGIEMIGVSQGTSNLSEPSKKFEELIENSKIVYNGDKMFEFSCECAVIGVTRQGNAVVYKEDYKNEKIDPLIALLIGLAAEKLDETNGNTLHIDGSFSF